jgi:hypothetical protein
VKDDGTIQRPSHHRIHPNIVSDEEFVTVGQSSSSHGGRGKGSKRKDVMNENLFGKITHLSKAKNVSEEEQRILSLFGDDEIRDDVSGERSGSTFSSSSSSFSLSKKKKKGVVAGIVRGQKVGFIYFIIFYF